MTETKILPLLTWRSAICDSGLPPTTRHVALTLSLWMNERAASAFPSVPTLVTATGLSERAVRSHLHDLVNAGWLKLVKASAGQRRGNEYEASTPARPAPAPAAPLHLTTVTGASDDAEGCTSCSQSLQDLSTNSGGGARKRASRPGTRIPEIFEVTHSMAEWAGTNCPDVDWTLATKTFVAHWKAASRDAVKKNWEQAWREWLLKDQASIARYKRQAIR